jgi:hypothetical protein
VLTAGLPSTLLGQPWLLKYYSAKDWPWAGCLRNNSVNNLAINNTLAAAGDASQGKAQRTSPAQVCLTGQLNDANMRRTLVVQPAQKLASNCRQCWVQFGK